MTEFNALGLAEPLLRAITATGYTTPTPIQEQAIPHLLQGHDLLGIAQTGTGKTAAFAAADPAPLAQIAQTLRAPLDPRARPGPDPRTRRPDCREFQDLRQADRRPRRADFRRRPQRPPDPGLSRRASMSSSPRRAGFSDLFSEKHIRLDKTEVLVLDEADHMLDLGFVIPIKRIAREVPAQRQSLFFSATMPKEISALADTLLRDPIRVSVAPVATTAERIDQSVVFVAQSEKRAVLTRMLRQPEMGRTLVFARTKTWRRPHRAAPDRSRRERQCNPWQQEPGANASARLPTSRKAR